MSEYIATFYSHYGAIRFHKVCLELGMKAEIMPVPRSLSSSCGTCVRFYAKEESPLPELTEELEQLVRMTASGWLQIYQTDE